MHIVDVVDQIADKLPELTPVQLAQMHNMLMKWGLVEKTIIPSPQEGQFIVLGEDSE